LQNLKINLNPRQTAQTLFNFASRGVASQAGVVTSKDCAALVNVFDNFRKKGEGFVTPQRERGRVIQEMQICYLERLKMVPEELTEAIIPLASCLESWFQQFRLFAEPLAENLRDTALLDTSFNSIGIHHYPAKTGGITPHRDFSSSLNLIVIFVLSGDAALYTCQNRKGEAAEKVNCAPGSMVVLRAPRNQAEQRYRPFHYLTSSTTDRYSLIFRQETGPAGAGYA